MDYDLSEIAENAYDSAVADDTGDSVDQQVDTEQSDSSNDIDTTNNNDETVEGEQSDDEADGETTQENEQEQDGDETERQNEQSSDGDQQEETEQAPQISDEQLQAELERRGLSVLTKQQQQQIQNATDPRFARPQEVSEEVWGGMSDANRFIYNQLPYMEIRDANGNTLKIKTDDQIPEGFEWASEAEKQRFYSKELPAQSNRAENLGRAVYDAQQRHSQRMEQQNTARYVVDTVEKLQRNGIVPKFTAKSGTKEFDSDPSVLLVNEIISTWQECRQRGENISLETAAMLHKGMYPDKYVVKGATTPTDRVRKNKSTNINGGSRGTPKDVKDTYDGRSFPTGTMPSDIADFYMDSLD